MRAGTVGAVARMVVLAVVGGAALLPAQPPAPHFDPDLTPVQRLEPPVAIPDSPRPSAGNGVVTPPPRGPAAVFDPPPPVLQLAVRTPAHVPVGAPVPYKITVANASQAKALRVRVRMPWPDGAAALTKCEPKPDKVPEVSAQKPLGPQELMWDVGDMQRGEQKAFELTFTPDPAKKKVSGTAYVNFEYGAKVETSIDVPKLSVTRTATPQAAVGELVTVRVEVRNPGTVPIPKVKLAESAPPGAEYRGADAGEASATVPGLRTFDLGTLGPGQTAAVQYQLLVRQAGEMRTSSAVSSDETKALELATASSVTKILQPALKLTFTGAQQVASKAPARYKATVQNAGTLPLTNVEVAVSVPDGLTVTKQRAGGRQDGNRRVWTVPKLAAGEAEEVEFQAEPESGVAGKKQFKATAQDGRRLVDVQTAEVVTEFVGRADLRWSPVFGNDARVSVGRQGTITVTVKNQGAETDKGVRLRVQFPPEVRYKDTGRQKAAFDNATLTFDIQPLAPGKTAEFDVAYEGLKPGLGQFVLMLEGESLGDRPLRKEQSVTVER